MIPKQNSFAALCALLLLAGCSKPQPAPSATPADDDPAEETSMPAPAPPQPEPPKDYAKLAGGMEALLSDRPDCQRFHEELRTIGQTPMGSKAARDPAEVVAEAHAQGCSKKSEQQPAQ